MSESAGCYLDAKRRCGELGVALAENVLCAIIGRQKLSHFRRGRHIASYDISTSANPPSCIENSYGTPLGLHEIAEKIGGGAEPGMVFKGRVPTGKKYWELQHENENNLVASRILRLKGLEPGKNQGEGLDSYKRYIYIHGTNHEEKIGKPSTSGCIVLSNADIIKLYDSVPEGSMVWIE